MNPDDIAAEAFKRVVKGRRYVDDPSEAPEGVEVHEGEQGGLYYETEEGSSGGTNPERITEQIRSGSEADFDNPAAAGMQPLDRDPPGDWPLDPDIDDDTVSWVPVEQITSGQEAVDLGTVRHYMEELRSGDHTSPARGELGEDGTVNLVDGNHTAVAGWLLGHDRVPVDGLDAGERYEMAPEGQTFLYEKVATEAWKEAVTSGTGGAGQATYGGADDEDEEEKDCGEPHEHEEGDEEEEVHTITDEELREKASSALSAVAKEWTGPHEGPQGGTFWEHSETGERRYQENKPEPGEGGEEEGGGESGPLEDSEIAPGAEVAIAEDAPVPDFVAGEELTVSEIVEESRNTVVHFEEADWWPTVEGLHQLYEDDDLTTGHADEGRDEEARPSEPEPEPEPEPGTEEEPDGGGGVFTEAETVDELEDMLREEDVVSGLFGPGADLSGFEDEQVEVLARGFESLHEQEQLDRVSRITTEYNGDDNPAGWWNDGDRKMYLNPEMFDEGKKVQWFESMEAASPLPEATLYHEIGHARYYETTSSRERLGSDEKVRKNRELIREEVSHYAATNGQEFVAEVYSGSMAGIEYSDEIYDLYDAVNGPELPEPAVSLDDEDFGRDIEAKADEELLESLPEPLADEVLIMEEVAEEAAEGEEAEKLAKAALSLITKEWTGPHEGPQGGTYWEHTETGERRYQEEKPEPGEGSEEDPAEEGGDGTVDTGGIEVEGDYIITPTNQLAPEDIEEGDRVLVHGTEMEVGPRGIFAGPADSGYLVDIELEDGNTFTPSVDDMAGRIEGDELELGDWDVDTLWGARFANGVETGELGINGTDGFVGVRDIQHHASDIDNPELLAAVLAEEKEGRNSKSAVGALESRIRALDGDPDELLEAYGYGSTGGGGEGDFPIEDYEDATDALDDVGAPGEDVYDPISWGPRAGGIENDEVWSAISRHAETEDLADWLVEEVGESERLNDAEKENLRASILDGEGTVPHSVVRGMRRFEPFQMTMGLLYYRDDAHVDVGDIYQLQKRKGGDNVRADMDDIADQIRDTMDHLDPVQGSALAAHTGKIGPEDPSESGSSWNGIYYSSGDGGIGVKKVGSPSSYGSPGVVSHELGHSLHYLHGLGGGGTWGNNEHGKPKEMNVSDSLIQDLAMDTGLAMDTDWSADEVTDEMIEEYAEEKGVSEESVRMQRDLKQEWERYQRSQLGTYDYDEVGPADPDDLEEGEYYVVDQPDGKGIMEYVGRRQEYYQFEVPKDSNSNTAVPIGIAPDDFNTSYFVNETENVKTPSEASGVTPLRSYQDKGLHEFFTVTFSHWINDRKKLDKYHEEMADFYEEYFAPAAKGEVFPDLTFPDGPEDVEEGQEVLYTESMSDDARPSNPGEITEIRDTGVRVDDEHGGHWLEWEQVAWEE